MQKKSTKIIPFKLIRCYPINISIGSIITWQSFPILCKTRKKALLDHKIVCNEKTGFFLNIFAYKLYQKISTSRLHLHKINFHLINVSILRKIFILIGYFLYSLSSSYWVYPCVQHM